jgi:hypothetical protein
MFRVASIILAKGADATKHRATVKGDSFEYTLAAVPMGEFEVAARVCKEEYRD